MSPSPRGQIQACSDHTSRVTVLARGPQGMRLPGLGAWTRPPVFLHREQVARKRHGVTAGAEVHGGLGAVGGLQREREVPCAWSGDTVPVGHVSFACDLRAS